MIILSMIDLTDEIMACMEAGAARYLLKESSFEDLVEMIRAVHRGESFCSPRMTASLFSRVAELPAKKHDTNTTRFYEADYPRTGNH